MNFHFALPLCHIFKGSGKVAKDRQWEGTPSLGSGVLPSLPLDCQSTELAIRKEQYAITV
jgi:hypothetical protein